MTTAHDEAEELQNALSLLSPQERAAITDDTDSAVEALDELQDNGNRERNPILELPAAAAADANTEADDDEASASTNEVGEVANADTIATAARLLAAQAAAPAVDANAAPAAPAAAADPDDLFTLPAMLTRIAPAVEDYDDKIVALEAAERAAFKSMMTGELTDDQYLDEQRRIRTETRTMERAQDKHIADVDRREAYLSAQWESGIVAQKAAAKAEGVDYDASPNLHQAWDRWVRQLGGMQEHESKSGAWFLKEAHRLTKLQYNLVATEAAPANTGAKAVTAVAVAPKKVTRAPDLSMIPPTLGRAPAASTNSEGEGGEFAYIDKLQGLAQESALARLTPDQEARYLADS